MIEEVSLDEARAAKAEALDRLRSIPSLAGVGITESAGRYMVKVNLTEPSFRSLVPDHIGRVPVVVEVVGTVVKRAVRSLVQR